MIINKNKDKISINKSSYKPYYEMLPKLFLILTIIFLLWVIIIITIPMIIDVDPTWTGISASFWIIMISVLIGVFIVVDIFLYVFPKYDITQKVDSIIKPKIEMMKGKRVYEYTFPQDTKGGMFSKTYIELDEKSIIRIRHQMLTAEKLWK
jgi:hypothetical protein